MADKTYKAGERVDYTFTDYDVRVLDEENRVIEYTASTEGVDRYQSRVVGWELANYEKNPVVLFAHNSSLPPIGRAIRINQVDGQLRVAVQFAPKETYEFADTIFKLSSEGYLRALSVGFIPGEIEYDKKAHVTDLMNNELVEISVVPVPANPDALALAYRRDLIPSKYEELMVLNRAGLITDIEGEDVDEVCRAVTEWCEERHVVSIVDEEETVSITFEKDAGEEYEEARAMLGDDGEMVTSDEENSSDDLDLTAAARECFDTSPQQVHEDYGVTVIQLLLSEFDVRDAEGLPYDLKGPEQYRELLEILPQALDRQVEIRSEADLAGVHEQYSTVSRRIAGIEETIEELCQRVGTDEDSYSAKVLDEVCEKISALGEKLDRTPEKPVVAERRTRLSDILDRVEKLGSGE